ncbi:MAG TPA: HPP family protein [Prosthecobacter sp.]
MNLLQKLRGDSVALPPRPSARNIALAFAGGFLAIAVIALLAQGLHVALVLGSFGASCVLVFGYPDVPFSQPRNVILGHLFSTLVGLVFVHLAGPHWWSVSLAVGSAIALMMATRTVHPPAGSNPVIVFLMQPDWMFAIFPTLTGSLLLVLTALLFHNLTRRASWPKYW